jgi:hypothetical protein
VDWHGFRRGRKIIPPIDKLELFDWSPEQEKTQRRGLMLSGLPPDSPAATLPRLQCTGRLPS